MMILLGLTFILPSCSEETKEISFPEVTSAFETTFNVSNGAFTIDEEQVLPNVIEGAIIDYQSSDVSVIDQTGVVKRPQDNDAIITLSVTIKKGGNEQMIEYTVTVKKANETPTVNGDYRIIPDGRVEDGALVISGGNSSSNLPQIDDAFVELGGGNDAIHILIVPTSSGGPSASAVSSMMSSYGGRYGITEDQFSVLQVTGNTRELADDPTEVAKVNQATAIWFTGGDQYLVTNALWRSDGTPSNVLQAMFDRWDEGNIVIGGSSAGAAIMSRVMIGGGLSVGALAYDHISERALYNGDDYYYGALLVNETGFGFFEGGVVDQHFNTRDRLGRLIEAAYVEGQQSRGFGVGENSAMIYNHTTKDISVIGEVMIVDTRDATRVKTATNLSRYENIRLSLLKGHSTYNLETETFHFIREDGRDMIDKTETPGNQYELPTNIDNFTGSYDSLMDFIAYKLLDNRKDFMYTGRNNMPYVSSFTIVDHAYYKELNDIDDRIIFEKRFYFESGRTEAYYDAAERSYSFKDVIMDIIPLEDALTELE
jgi:cyanophycinase